MKIPLPRDRALAGTSREVTSKFLKDRRRRRCFGIQLFEDRCNFSIEHDNKYLFSRSERSERRVNNCLSRLRGTALSVMAVWARLT